MKNFFEKYENHLTSGALILGFIIDNLTLKRIDLPFENTILFSYLIISGVGILILNYSERRKNSGFWLKINRFAPIIIQFVFGNLFSAFFVFYSRSANFLTSLPFLIMLVALLIGNEVLKKHYSKVSFQISIYFITLFSFLIFFVPVVIKQMGWWVFLLSGIVSLLIISLFVHLNFVFTKERTLELKNKIRKNITIIFITINVLYFLNFIPPIPLSMKDMGPYNSVVRVGDDYRMEKKDVRKIADYLFLREAVLMNRNSNLYFYSAVFAPTKLNTKVFHVWYYFDDAKNRWIEKSTIGFPIVGGRGTGYRGYSEKMIDAEGNWRVDVETQSGQIIGRERFRVEFKHN